MKRREPSAERSSEAPQGLRAQLSRAVGGSLDAIRSVLSSNPKTVDVSKQRLSDVLWNDRTLLATHETARAPAPQRDETELPDEEATAENVVEADLVEALEADLVELVPEPDLTPNPEPVESPADSAGARMRAEARRSEVMRARLEATKARLATRLTAMPNGVAPVAEDVAAPEVAANVEADVTRAAAPEVAAEIAPEVTTPAPTEPPAREIAPPAAAAAATRDDDDDDDGEEEPIRTRSMARLLASQGHRSRALKIYDALLAANGGDAELRAEADALRRAD